MQKHEREDEWIHVIHENIDDEFHQWTRLASPCWGIGKESPKVSRTNVLNTKIAKEEKDEKHMTPLQLDLIEHLQMKKKQYSIPLVELCLYLIQQLN